MSLDGINASGNDAYLKAYMQYMQNAAPADATAVARTVPPIPSGVGASDSTTFTGNSGKSNSNAGTYAWVGLTALAAAGIYLLTRGKGKKAASEVAKDTASGAASIAAKAEEPAKEVAARASKLTRKQRKNARKVIERQLELERSGQFTNEELVAYSREMGYQAPTETRRAIMRENSRQAIKEYRDAHKLRNNATWTANTPKTTPKPSVPSTTHEIENLTKQLNIANRKAASYKKMGKPVSPQVQQEIDRLTKLIETRQEALNVVV